MRLHICRKTHTPYTRENITIPIQQIRTQHSSTRLQHTFVPAVEANENQVKTHKSYTCKLQHMPLLLILQIHRAANISRSLAELSAILRHKDEDIPPQSAAFCGVRSEQPITGRQAEEIQDRKSIQGAGH